LNGDGRAGELYGEHLLDLIGLALDGGGEAAAMRNSAAQGKRAASPSRTRSRGAAAMPG